MTNYVIGRILSLFVVLFGVSFLAFFFVHLIPGDPATAILGERATADSLARVREQLGLNDPLPVQYAKFLGRLAAGDLGTSVRTNNPVSVDFSTKFPATIELAVTALIFAVVIGVPAGMLAATRRNSIFDLLS